MHTLTCRHTQASAQELNARRGLGVAPCRPHRAGCHVPRLRGQSRLAADDVQHLGFGCSRLRFQLPAESDPLLGTSKTDTTTSKTEIEFLEGFGMEVFVPDRSRKEDPRISCTARGPGSARCGLARTGGRAGGASSTGHVAHGRGSRRSHGFCLCRQRARLPTSTDR